MIFSQKIIAVFYEAEKMKKKFIVLCLALIFCGCAYVNTLYNGASAYRKAQRIKRQYERMSKDSAQIAYETSSLYKRAIGKAEKTLLEFPKSENAHDDAYFLKGISLFEIGEYLSAINAFEVLTEYYPDSKYHARALLYFVKCYFRIEDFFTAQEYLDMLLQKYPAMAHNSELVLLRADLAVHLEGKFAALENLENRLAETSDNSYKLLLIERLMAITMEIPDYEKALSYTAKMPHFDRKYSSAYYRVELRKLNCLRKLAKYDEAQKLADLMLSNSNYLYNKSEIMFEKGILLVDMGKYDEAVKVFEDIVAGVGNSKIICKAWFEYALISIDVKGELDSGAVRLEKALGLVGDDVEFRNLIVTRLNGLKKIAELKTAFEENDPFKKVDSAYYRYRIGEEFWLSAQIPDSALNYFAALIGSMQAPDSVKAKALYSRAYILKEIKKDSVSADAIFNEIINKYPNFEAAKSAQNMLGMPVTFMTRRDSANAQLAIAEKIEAQNQDAYSQEAYYAYLLCAMKYPDISDIAAKSLYVAGWIVNKRDAVRDGTVDTNVVKIFVKLCKDYPESEYCKSAKNMMEANEVKSFAAQYSSRIEKADSLTAAQIGGVQTVKSADEKRKAVLPDFQNWI